MNEWVTSSAWFIIALMVLMVLYTSSLNLMRSSNIQSSKFSSSTTIRSNRLEGNHPMTQYIQYTQHRSPAPMASSSSQQPATVEVIAKIEAVFKNITDSLLSEENPRVPKNDIFVRIKYKKRTTSNDEPALPNAEPSQEFKDVCWPAMGRPREAWRFSMTNIRCHCSCNDADSRSSGTGSNPWPHT